MKYKKRIFILLAIAFLFFLLIESVIVYYGHMDAPDVECDYIIILGAKVNGDKVSLALKYRLDRAIQYMNKDDNIEVVVTGAKGYNEQYSEASIMKQYLIDNGIDEKRIIIEDNSFSTFENLKNSYDIVGESKVLIATNDFHIFRSILLANRVGFEAYPLSAKTPKVVKTQLYIREFFALMKSFLLDRS